MVTRDAEMLCDVIHKCTNDGPRDSSGGDRANHVAADLPTNDRATHSLCDVWRGLCG